jgi:hypothetical protein
MVEHLIDKPNDQTVDHWLNDVKATANLSPRISEERTVVDGAPALRVITGSADSKFGNIYAIHGASTFYISFDQRTPAYALCRRIISTFRFKRRS